MPGVEVATPPLSPPGPSADDGRSRRIGRLDPALPALLALPWVVLLLEPNWVYSKLIYDPWIYFGYYHDLAGHLRDLEGAYYGSRLSAILPGWLAYRLLPPLAANMVLHLSVYYACVVSLYLTLRPSVGRRGAFLAAVAMGTNVWVLEATGRDYVDGYGMVYYLLTVLLLTSAGRSRRPGALRFAAGVTAGALVVANVFYVVFLPALLSRYAATSRREPPAVRVRGLVLAGAGLIGLLLAFSVLNLGVAGNFWFLGPSVRFVTSRQSGAPNPFTSHSATWLLGAAHLATALTVVLGWLATRGRAVAPWVADPESCSGFGREFFGVLALYAAYDLFGGGGSLEIFAYTNVFLPAAYLALAPLLARLSGPLGRRGYLALAAAAVVALVAPYAVPKTGSELDRAGLPQMVVAYAPVLTAALLLRTRAPGLATGVMFFAMVGVSNYLTQPMDENETDLPLWKNPVLAARHRAYNRDRRSVFLAVDHSLREFLAADVKGGASFWFDKGEPHGHLFKVVTCTYALRRTAGEQFPDLAGRFRTGSTFVVLSSEPDALGRARVSLRRRGFDARQRATRRVTEGAIDFTITVVEVARIGPAD